jgi:sugar phosphate permease
MEHKGFDEEDLGMIASSFSMAYGINKLVFSVIADHVNSRKMFTSGLLLSAICVMLFPYGTTPLACSALWFVQGIVQGFGWPAALKLLKGSCRPNMFGFWWSVVSSAGNLAATLSPLFVAYVMSVTHWYVSYYIIGGVTILSSFVMYFTISDLPQSNESKKTDSPSSGPLYTYKDLFTCKELWYISFIYFVLYLVKYAICDWGQLYFIQQLKMKDTLAGASIGLVQFGGVFGNMVWGYISDRTLSIVPSNSKTPRAPALACCSFLFTVLLFFFSTYLDKDVPEVSDACQ